MHITDMFRDHNYLEKKKLHATTACTTKFLLREKKKPPINSSSQLLLISFGIIKQYEIMCAIRENESPHLVCLLGSIS